MSENKDARPQGQMNDFRKCAHRVEFFFNQTLELHIRSVHGEIYGRTVLGEVHSMGPQNKTLISNTDNDRQSDMKP